jgi:hypothetical protein
VQQHEPLPEQQALNLLNLLILVWWLAWFFWLILREVARIYEVRRLQVPGGVGRPA